MLNAMKNREIIKSPDFLKGLFILSNELMVKTDVSIAVQYGGK